MLQQEEYRFYNISEYQGKISVIFFTYNVRDFMFF